MTTSDNGPDASVPLLLVCVFLQLFFEALLLETFAISIKLGEKKSGVPELKTTG